MHKDLPGYTYIHSEIAKGLRRGVSEIHDFLQIYSANMIAKTTWAAKSGNAGALQTANAASDALFRVVPYVRRKIEAVGRAGGAGFPASRPAMTAEELMYKFIEKQKAKKKELAKE